MREGGRAREKAPLFRKGSHQRTKDLRTVKDYRLTPPTISSIVFAVNEREIHGSTGVRCHYDIYECPSRVAVSCLTSLADAIFDSRFSIP